MARENESYLESRYRILCDVLKEEYGAAIVLTLLAEVDEREEKEKESMMYAIQNSVSKNYYTAMTGIGPAMGGDVSEAFKFTSKEEALKTVEKFPGYILWDIVKIKEG